MLQANKIHKQFGHSSAESKDKLINSEGLLDNNLVNIIENVSQFCNTCVGFKKAVFRLSKAKYFNETVSVDSHETEQGLNYFHMIGNYSNMVIIKNKSLALMPFVENQLNTIEASRKKLNENVGKFIGDNSYKIRQKLNIKVTTKPDLCKCHKQFLINKLDKIFKI